MKLKGIFILLPALLLASCYTRHKEAYNRLFIISEYGDDRPIPETKPFYFRYQVSNVSVDIWSDDSVHFKGKVFCYTVHLKKRRKYYGINFPVPDSVVNKIVKRFGDRHIEQILMEKDTARETTQCDDCGTLEYDYVNGRNSYRKQCYPIWTGWKTDSMDLFKAFIEENISIKNEFSRFIDYLPDGTYQLGMLPLKKTTFRE